MRYRVRRQDDHGNVFTVPHDGVWYENLEAAAAVKRGLEQHPHKQTYWIEDEHGCTVASPEKERRSQEGDARTLTLEDREYIKQKLDEVIQLLSAFFCEGSGRISTREERQKLKRIVDLQAVRAQREFSVNQSFWQIQGIKR